MKDDLVQWNEEMLIPIELPIKDNNLYLKIFDKDKVTDELCATVQLPLQSITKYGPNSPNTKWLNLYGGPNGESGTLFDKMNEDPNIASQWKGRVLVQFFCEDVKYPVLKMKNIEDDLAKQVIREALKEEEYMLVCEFGQGICLPKSEDYQLKIVIGKHVIESGSPHRPANSEYYCNWDKRKSLRFKESFGKVERFPSVFVYLMEGSNAVCFYKDSLSNYLDPLAPLKWIELQPELALGKVKKIHKSGVISLRLLLHEMKNGPLDLNKLPQWKQSQQSRYKPHRLRVSVYQCRSLPPSDSTGTSDPFVEVWCPHAEKQRTQVCNDTNNPIFYQVLEIPFGFNYSLDSAPPVVLNVFDEDENLLKNRRDFIGRAVVFLHKLKEMNELSDGDQIMRPKWYPVKRSIHDGHDMRSDAAILCSFQLAREGQRFSFPAR